MLRHVTVDTSLCRGCKPRHQRSGRGQSQLLLLLVGTDVDAACGADAVSAAKCDR